MAVIVLASCGLSYVCSVAFHGGNRPILANNLDLDQTPQDDGVNKAFYLLSPEHALVGAKLWLNTKGRRRTKLYLPGRSFILCINVK